MQGCNLQESGIDLKALSACCLASKRPNMSQLNEKLSFFCAGNNKGVMPWQRRLLWQWSVPRRHEGERGLSDPNAIHA